MASGSLAKAIVREIDTDKYEQRQWKKSVFYTDAAEDKDLCRFIGITNDRIIHIPKDKTAIEAAFFWKVAVAAYDKGIDTKDITITGGAGLKHIFYDEAEIKKQDAEQKPLWPKILSRKGFLQYDMYYDINMTVIPEGKTFFKMLIESAFTDEVENIEGMTVNINDKFLNKDIVMLIGLNCNITSLTFTTNSNKVGIMFNCMVRNGLKQYKKDMNSLGWIKKEDIDIEETRNKIISMIKDNGHDVKDISDSIDWDDDYDEYTYDEAPEIIRDALEATTQPPVWIEDLYGYIYMKGTASFLGEQKAKEHHKLLLKALDISYKTRYIVGSIEAEGILADEKVTQFSLCIDSRGRLRMGKIWDEDKEWIHNRIGSYIEVEKLLTEKWNGSGNVLERQIKEREWLL